MRLITSPRAALAVILAGAVVLAACGGGEDSEVDAATSTPTAEPTSVSGELIATATPFASRPTPTIVSTNESGGGTNNGNGGGTEGTDATPTPAATPVATERTHVVVVGDTLSAIADQYDSTLEAIMEANGITDASLIFVGQELTIPGAAAAPEATATPEAGGLVHVVVEGDTLSAIAEHYGTTIEAITEANGLTDSVIWIGQELTIPEAAPAPEPTPEPTPTATPEGASGGGGSSTYTVQDGDTATDIAAAFDVTLAALAEANDLTIEELNNLLVGQVLTIPVAGE